MVCAALSNLSNADSSIRGTYTSSDRYVRPSFCWNLGHWKLRRACPSFPESGSFTSERERRGGCLCPAVLFKLSKWFTPLPFIWELTPILLKQKKKKRKNSFYDTTITMIPKPDKDITHKKMRDHIRYAYRCKNSQQNTSYWIQQYIKRIINYNQVGLIPGMQGWFNIWKAT